MTRIIGGSVGGRRLQAPRGASTRPTSDRVREALFSAVESWCGSLSGLRFLDLYAGSGAVGLEAWSRGAGIVTLVEQDRRNASLISKNARTIGFAKANVVSAPVHPTLRKPPAAPYDVVFLDPPYPLDDAAVVDDLQALAENDWLVPGALVVVERSARGGELAWPDAFSDLRQRHYGETVLWYGHAAHPSTVSSRSEE
ncbi:MAG: 16S rRNA (guanine(966)-N(2))-methyltransferase RsmD [Nocardioides sp.]